VHSRPPISMHRPGGRCYVLRATILLRLFPDPSLSG
jgi:hypothetical protein